MTEQQDQELDLPTAEITFKGRTMWIRAPRPEQILVWKRTLTALQGADVETWTADEVMRHLERGRKITDSLLVDKADVNWLDDQMLDGNVTLRDTAGIITLAAEAFEEKKATEGNRAEKRAAAKKATRKKAARA